MDIIATANADGTIREYFTRGVGIAGDVGSLIAETRFINGTPSTVYIHSNWRGDIVMATNSSGSVVGTYDYTTFGEPLSASGSYTPRFGFSSKERDASSLVYYGFRYYSPVLCRWITEDPIRESGGLNLYAAFGNNPVNFVDPDGRWVNFAVGFIVGGGLDLASQLLIEGRSFSELNGASILASGAAGALGVGLATGVSKIAANIAARSLLNGIGSAGIGYGAKAAQNIATGKRWDCDTGKAALLSGALGAVGSLTGDALQRGVDSLSQASEFANALSNGSQLFRLNEAPYLLPGEAVSSTVGVKIGTAGGLGVSNMAPVFQYFFGKD
jgi:RHS repeat-associated protein